MTNEKEFYLIGWESRTNNKAEFSGDGVIGKIWERVFKENLRDQITNVVSDEIYGVYSNYESDENGDYDYFVGYKVKDLNHIPQGLNGKKILAGPYKKFETKKGPVYQVVPEMWRQIWQDLKGKRAFKTDFEIYGDKAQDPNKAVVEIFIGTKE